MSNYMDTYRQWCTDPYFDEDTKAELKKMPSRWSTSMGERSMY